MRAMKTKSTPDAVNYTVQVVEFRVVREPGAARTQRPNLSDPVVAVAYLAAAGVLPDDGREHFAALYLDVQNQVVAAHKVSTGTLSASLVHPREVFGPALRLIGVASVILAHNHPSGDPAPSREDVRLTAELVKAGKLLQIPVHDHLIVGSGTGNCVSLASRGDM